MLTHSLQELTAGITTYEQTYDAATLGAVVVAEASDEQTIDDV